MDNVDGMGRNFYGSNGYGGPQQGSNAAGSVYGEDFFADAQTLEYSPFDEVSPEAQAGYPAGMDYGETEDRLPVAPSWMPEAGPEGYGVPEREEDSLPADDADNSVEEDYGTDGEDTAEEEDGADAGTPAGGSTEREAEESRKRAEHEAAEARRKAEWEARQQAKRDAEKEQLARIMAMGSEELVAESMGRVRADTEKLTRRSMKECVSEYVQTLCLEDAEFARRVMLPQKNMFRCIQYINRKAYEYVQDEMKAEGIQPGRGTPCYSSDIPDDMCYHWAEEYFRAMDVKEDREEEEKFVPKPYIGKSPAKPKSQKNTPKKSVKKKGKSSGTAEAPEKASRQKAPEKEEDGGQISFLGQMPFGDYTHQEGKAG